MRYGKVEVKPLFGNASQRTVFSHRLERLIRRLAQRVALRSFGEGIRAFEVKPAADEHLDLICAKALDGLDGDRLRLDAGVDFPHDDVLHGRVVEVDPLDLDVVFFFDPIDELLVDGAGATMPIVNPSRSLNVFASVSGRDMRFCSS